MNKTSLLDIYNEKYAQSYNHKFLTNPFSKISSDYEYELLKGLIKADTKWLDVGCGTGYFLSRFPGHERGGMDISPDMLAEAKRVNPDALLFREGDFRQDVPEWREQWSLISSMWYPYSYVESLKEVENTVLNMVNWLKQGGELFLPIGDLEDLRPNLPPVIYSEYEQVYAGTVVITGYTWTWIEDDDAKTHVNMVAPHIEHIVQLLQPFFETIEIIRYPPAYEGWVSRKAIIARNKISLPATDHTANIIRHSIPAPVNINTENILEQKVTISNPVSDASNRQLLREVFRRFKSGELLKALIKKMR